MSFTSRTAKGLAQFLTDNDLPDKRLTVHISQLNPGERSHPPHQHPGIEAFYMFEGQGTLEIDGETQVITTNESIVFDPTKLHGFTNTGSVPMRYMVIIARDNA